MKNTAEEKLFGVFQSEYNLLLQKATSITGNVHDANDALQDLAILIVNGKLNLSDIENYQAFLSRCVRNRCVDLVRKKSKLIDIDQEVVQNISSKDGDLQDIMDREFIRSLLNKYAPEMQEAFMMNVVDGYTIKEIAEEMGINESTLGQRLLRIKKAIAKEYPRSQSFF